MGLTSNSDITQDALVVACIPAFNEEKAIASIIFGAQKYVDMVIVCDDGSEDFTSEIAEKMGAKVIVHKNNKGYGAAIRSLFQEAKKNDAGIIITLDADGQHRPEDIPIIINHMKSTCSDIVIGSRFLKGSINEAPTWRNTGIKFITGLVSNQNLSITDAQSGFRAYNKKAIETLTITEDNMGASTEILIKANENGLKISEAPISIRYYKESAKNNPITHGFDVLFTTLKHMSINRPLAFYGLPGFISLLISLYFWIWNINVFTRTSSILTNVALISISTTIIGLMLLTTAIILWVVVSVLREKTL